MLKEISRFRGYKGPSDRRWFSDENMDLYVWFKHMEPARFHLTFDKQGQERSISWDNESGFGNEHFDMLGLMAHAVGVELIEDRHVLNPTALASHFLHASDWIEPWLADFIYARLLEIPRRNALRTGQGRVLNSF